MHCVVYVVVVVVLVVVVVVVVVVVAMVMFMVMFMVMTMVMVMGGGAGMQKGAAMFCRHPRPRGGCRRQRERSSGVGGWS